MNFAQLFLTTINTETKFDYYCHHSPFYFSGFIFTLGDKYEIKNHNSVPII